ncbi:MAG: selenocysteine-specific translation elongation factor [Deltaproteobacteria bacterium]|nr:selenocysteine-specific translation elongation factor [Candidatus Zymogenaceae bacterium]
MKQLILGTAGHIDHGKTSLIYALTGIDTDRLKEEKERGITIELGFAHLDLPSGIRLGIVDVPGHERFVKNMVAGAGGIDVVALVVAADEGVMPQTVEHLNILKLLDVNTGLVVITKTDLADDDFTGLVEEELVEFVSGTFLEGAPMVRVSSTERTGMDRLVSVLDELAGRVKARRTSGTFRLPVDRVFTMKGFGTVITGTLLSGGVKAGEEVAVMPKGVHAKVRGIQIHGEQKPEAVAGSRTALNLSGVSRDQLERGDVLISPGTIEPTYMADVMLMNLAGAPPLKNRTRARFHAGTSEIMAHVVLLDRDVLEPGDEAPVQVRLTEPAVLIPGDRFVLRSLSPVTTVGGGEVLNAHPKKHKRFSEDVLKNIERLVGGGYAERIEIFLKDAGAPGATAKAMAAWVGIPEEQSREFLRNLADAGAAVVVDADRFRYIAREEAKRLSDLLLGRLEVHHKAQPTLPGISKEELLSKMPWGVDAKLMARLLSDLTEKRRITLSGDIVALAGHKVSMKDDETHIASRAVELIRAGGLSPPSTQELAGALGSPEQDIKKLLAAVSHDGSIVRVKDTLYFDVDRMDDLKDRLVAFLKEKGDLTTQEFKEMTGSTRKYTIPLLEYFDSQKVTMRVGDVRKLRGGA